MPGRPFAVGGPSKNTNGGRPSAASSDFTKRCSASHLASISVSRLGQSAGSSRNRRVSSATAVTGCTPLSSHPLHDPGDERRQTWFGGRRHCENALEGCWLERLRNALVRDDGNSQDAESTVHGHDDFRHGRHSHYVRAHAAQPTVFGACLEVRPGHGHVDTFPHDNTLLSRYLACQ